MIVETQLIASLQPPRLPELDEFAEYPSGWSGAISRFINTALTPVVRVFHTVTMRPSLLMMVLLLTRCQSWGDFGNPETKKTSQSSGTRTGPIASVTVTSGGTNFTTLPAVTATGPGSGATFTAALTGTTVAS